MHRRLLFTAAVATGLLAAPCADAVNFCVETTAELRNALDAADNNSEDDQIRIKSGTYQSDDGNQVATFTTSEDRAITLRGGYFDVGPLECVGTVSDPTMTVIDGEQVRGALRLTTLTGFNAALTVQNLTLARGNAAERGGGLEVTSSMGVVLIERVQFRDNTAPIGGGLSGFSTGTFTVRNSVFRGNTASLTTGAASLTVNYENTQSLRTLVGGNTFVDNACMGSASCVGGVRVGGSGRAAVFNNAFVLSDGTDVEMDTPTLLVNNNLETFSGSPSEQSGNVNYLTPGFVDLFSGDYRLQEDSPLREAGTGNFDSGALDFDGNPRLNDTQYDIGAFETQIVVFRDGFEVEDPF